MENRWGMQVIIPVLDGKKGIRATKLDQMQEDIKVNAVDIVEEKGIYTLFEKNGISERNIYINKIMVAKDINYGTRYLLIANVEFDFNAEVNEAIQNDVLRPTVKQVEGILGNYIDDKYGQN